MSDERLRILHVFGRMGRGGAEMWLMNVLRRIDRERFSFDFAVHRERAGEFDDEIRALGCAIHVVPSYRNPARYAWELGSLLSRGRYHIAHAHVSHFSGYVLAIARALGISARIAHSHTAVPTGDDSRVRSAYKRLMRASIHANATLGLGCSSEACAALYGDDWRTRRQVQVLHYGYDFERFTLPDRARLRAAVRAELGLAEDDVVIGHIGRFVKPKNHAFIVELAAASHERRQTRQKFVLVGDGELRADVARAVAERGLDTSVRMTGQRSDIPALLASFDVCILPSLWEGLPVTMLEAQAAGVPCVLSDRVSAEAVVLEQSVIRLPLGDPRSWLEAIDALIAGPRLEPERALERMRASEFAIEHHIERMQAIYEQQAPRHAVR